MKKNKFYITLLLGVLIVGLVGWTINKESKAITNSSANSAVQKLTSLEKTQNSKIELKDAHGKPVNFSDFKGKIVFVNNWATWCRPCTMEMPSIQKLKEHFETEELVFVMISYDRNVQTSIAWMKNQGYSLPVYSRGKDLPLEFLTRGIPATFILDRKGEILYRHVGMSNYSSPNFVSRMEEWLVE